MSLEHTELLGDTVAEIARDKAQVAPTTAPLVTGADGAALEAIRLETDAITVGSDNADVIAVENGMRSDVESDVSITGPDWTLETNLSLLGRYQATNAGVAATIARQVAAVDPSTIATGLRKATWPGRFEIVSTNPMTVLDGSHNPGATAKLSDLLERYDYDDLHVVFAAMSDKDHERMVSELPSVDTAFVTHPDVGRAEDVAVLTDVFDGHADTIHSVESVAEATERALDEADETDCVLVTGSLYAVAEARDRWTRLVVPKHGGRLGKFRHVLRGRVSGDIRQRRRLPDFHDPFTKRSGRTRRALHGGRWGQMRAFRGGCTRKARRDDARRDGPTAPGIHGYRRD